LAIDVSGSMSYIGCAGTPCITPRVASAAMSMVTARTENSHHFVAFSDKIVPLMIDPRMNLDEVLQTMKLVRGQLEGCPIIVRLLALTH
jgi:60 kDa SS-A/Ro ribonucleoprotein